MTLRKLIEEINIKVEIPKELGNLSVINEYEYCRYSLKEYFLSAKFKHDIKHCLYDFKIMSSMYPCFLRIERHEDRDYSIYINVDGDFID